MDKDLTVHLTYTEEATMLIQIKSGDTMRLSARKSYRTYNIISGGIVFHFKNSENEHPDEIKNGLSSYCSGLINKVQKYKIRSCHEFNVRKIKCDLFCS